MFQFHGIHCHLLKRSAVAAAKGAPIAAHFDHQSIWEPPGGHCNFAATMHPLPSVRPSQKLHDDPPRNLPRSNKTEDLEPMSAYIQTSLQSPYLRRVCGSILVKISPISQNSAHPGDSWSSLSESLAQFPPLFLDITMTNPMCSGFRIWSMASSTPASWWKMVERIPASTPPGTNMEVERWFSTSMLVPGSVKGSQSTTGCGEAHLPPAIEIERSSTAQVLVIGFSNF